MRQEVLSHPTRVEAVSRPAYEQSVWLKPSIGISIDGDPPTPEAFANTYACLHNATLYFLWTDGPWWGKTWGNLRDELDHWNSWQAYEAQHQQPSPTDSALPEITYPNLLAVSYRRLHALLETESIDRWEYPLFLHLHELIREAALMAAEQPLLAGHATADPEPPRSPLYRQPVWELLHPPAVMEQPDHQRILDFSHSDAPVKYGFTYEDLREELPETGARTVTQCYFSNATQAAAIYAEHLAVIPYSVSALMAYDQAVHVAQAVPLAEQWYPPMLFAEGRTG